jgi:hypothetical protein
MANAVMENSTGALARQARTPSQSPGWDPVSTTTTNAQMKSSFRATARFWNKTPRLTRRPWARAATRITTVAAVLSGTASRQAPGSR